MESGLGLAFERLKVYREERLCEKCGSDKAVAQYVRVDAELTKRLHDIDPAGYLEISSNKVKSVLVRGCVRCSYQWIELPVDEWVRHTNTYSQDAEEIRDLATLIHYKLEGRMTHEMNGIPDYIRDHLYASNAVILAITKNKPPRQVRSEVADLIATGFHLLTCYRKAYELQNV